MLILRQVSIYCDMLEDDYNAGTCHWHWSDKEHHRAATLDETKLTVTFHHHQQSLCCAAIRGTKSLKANMEHVFEVELGPPLHGQAKMVGLGTRNTPLHASHMDYYPIMGRDSGSWGLNYDGTLYHNGETRKYVTTIPSKGPELQKLVIGVHYDAYYGTLSFEVDGVSCGLAYENVPPSLELYPMVCASSNNSAFTLLYSRSSVLSLKALCRGVIRMEVRDPKDIDKLPLPPHVKGYVAFSAGSKVPSKRVRHLIAS